MAVERNYKCTDVDMLIATRTICGNFRKHQKDLVTVRSSWADPFIANLESRVDQAMTDHLGVDSQKGLKAATETMQSIQQAVIKDLGLFRIQVDVDYSEGQKDTMFGSLGFSSHYAKAKGGNQEELIQLLYKFKTNMDDALKTELTTKGMQPTLIDGIVAATETFKNAEVQQEILKSARSGIKDEAITEFNGIHGQIIGVCKIAQVVFADDETIKALFSFRRIVGAQSYHPAKDTAPEIELPASVIDPDIEPPAAVPPAE